MFFQNVVDITMILWQLKNEGYRFSRQDFGNAKSLYNKTYKTLWGLCD